MKTRTLTFNPKAIVSTALLLTLAFTSRSYSDPLPITVLDSQYTTIVGDRYLVPTTTNFPGYYFSYYSRTQASSVPISDTLFDHGGGLTANATAGFLEASALTLTGQNQRWDPWISGAGARLQSALSFSPVISQTGSITLQFAGWYEWFYTAGNVRLVNITSGNEMWNYGWTNMNRGNIPWVDATSPVNYPRPLPDSLTTQPRSTATLTIATDFNASDIYELTMYVGAGSDHDHEGASIKLFGLQIVPEPSVFALTGLAAFGLLSSRRRRK